MVNFAGGEIEGVSAASGVALVRESGSRDELHLDGLKGIGIGNDYILYRRNPE